MQEQFAWNVACWMASYAHVSCDGYNGECKIDREPFWGMNHFLSTMRVFELCWRLLCLGNGLTAPLARGNCKHLLTFDVLAPSFETNKWTFEIRGNLHDFNGWNGAVIITTPTQVAKRFTAPKLFDFIGFIVYQKFSWQWIGTTDYLVLCTWSCSQQYQSLFIFTIGKGCKINRNHWNLGYRECCFTQNLQASSQQYLLCKYWNRSMTFLCS